VLRAASASALAAAALVLAAGCGGSAAPTGQRALNAFLRDTARGRTFAARFPHTPGSLPCTALDPTVGKRVPATCSTDVSLGENGRVVVTFTVSWSHGSQNRTWFVFLRPDGTVAKVSREGVAG
jgi:hypothetical protein